jgi:hypothetical protein
MILFITTAVRTSNPTYEFTRRMCAQPNPYYAQRVGRLLVGRTVMAHTSWVYFVHERSNVKQEVLGRTTRLLSLIRHGPHWKRRVQQFFYCCLCIRYRGNVSTEPLPSNDTGIFTEPLPSNDNRMHIGTHKLMGGNYEVRRWDGLRCRDIHTKFHEDWFRHLNTHTDSYVIS